MPNSVRPGSSDPAVSKRLARACAVAALLSAVMTAMATSADAADRTPPSQGPFYDLHTKSYFELRFDNTVGKPQWPNAKRQAARRVYKGLHGRLAIVRDPETLDFLRSHFKFYEPAWIGLRFFCKFRKLIWVNGDIQGPHNDHMWHSPWYAFPNLPELCNKNYYTWLPIYLTKDGIYWRANGPEKYYVSYLVEYPTGSNTGEKTTTEPTAAQAPMAGKVGSNKKALQPED